MKKTLLFIFSLLLTLTSLAQSNIDYPRFDIDSNGQQVVVMTIQQAQSLDNSTDLLILMEKANSQIGSYDSICLKVINDKEEVIVAQRVEISKLRQSLDNKDEQISSLQKEINSYIKKVEILEKQLANRNGVIDEKSKQITKLKIKMIVGGVGGAITIIALVLGIVLIN
jgi:chromosome segregation ATPase